jgi:hypothetical protein
MVVCMQQRTTVTSEVHCETLATSCRAIQNKMPGLLTPTVMLLYDNAHPHIATHTRVPLQHLNLELFNNLPCSPTLFPSNYHQFTYLHNWLQSQHFNNNEELLNGVKTWLDSQAVDFFHKGIQKHLYSLIQVPPAGNSRACTFFCT